MGLIKLIKNIQTFSSSFAATEDINIWQISNFLELKFGLIRISFITEQLMKEHLQSTDVIYI
jgi:hypothetical protein